MNKRGAIGLPINVLVIIIISLVIFAGGITLLYKLMGEAESVKASLDAQTEAELRRLLEVESQRVALPLHTAYLYPGDFHSFGLGILNIDEFGHEFDINIELSKAYDETEDFTEEAKTKMEEEGWLLFFPKTDLIENNEYQLIPLGVKVPKGSRKGTYIFDVNVFFKDHEEPYGNLKKFYVVVK